MISPEIKVFIESGRTGVWILHADKIPPHIGISDSSGFYSLKVKGKDVGIPLVKIIALIEKKKIPTLIYEINEISKVPLLDVFDAYNSASSMGATCLEPIKQATNIEVAETVHDLLKELTMKNAIRRIMRMNLPETFISVPNYSKVDIQNRLKHLEK